MTLASTGGDSISTQAVAWLGQVGQVRAGWLLWKYHASARGALLFVVRQQRKPPVFLVGAELSQALGWAESWEGEVASL